MSSARSKWLLGCGIGCGVVLLVVILGIVGSAVFVKRTFSGFEEAIATRETLDERFGETRSFTPSVDGGFAPERMEAFLRVRDASQPSRERIAERFASFMITPEEAREMDEKPLGEKLGFAWDITKSAMGLAPELGAFLEVRNQAMLDADMGLGEYTYIYAIAYYAWLEHSPRDGPEDARPDEETIGSAASGNTSLPRVRDDLRVMLRNQLEALEAQGGEGDWHLALRDEVAALETDSWRMPWQDGVPPAIAASLEPYRDRLEATYAPATNGFELGRGERDGRFTIRAD
jgi:hypothetical protein